MESISKDIRLSKFEDHYIVGNNGVYYKVGLTEGSVVERLLQGLSPEKIAEEINLDFNVVEQIIAALKENCVITKEKKKTRFNPFYIRIPLFDANKLLDAILKVFFRNRAVNHIYALVISMMIVSGIALSTIRRGEIFTVDSIKDDVVIYVAVYVMQFVTVMLHELAHGLSCNYFGGRAGKIGVALVAFNPAMFCEISSIREFRERYKKVFCCSAGLMVNASFVFLYNVADMIYPTNFFKMMIMINITNIIFNILPIIRLDGYWIFSFATGIDNLYTRSIKKALDVKSWFKNVNAENVILTIYGIITVALLGLGLFGFTKTILDLLIKAYWRFFA